MDLNQVDENSIKEMLENIQNLDKIPPDLIARARRLTNTRAGREMIKEMENKGINKEMIEKLMPAKADTIDVLVMRPNGIVKSRKMQTDASNCSLLHATTPMKVVKNDYTVWYDASILTTNKKASQWLGFNVGGMIVIIGENLDKINFKK